MTTFPVPYQHRLAHMIATGGRQATVTRQQAVSLQSGLSAAIPQPWADLTLLNGWNNSGGGYPPARYRQFTGGVTEVQGVIAGGTISNGTVLAVLPSGAYNTAYQWPFEALILAGASAAAEDTPLLIAQTNGDLIVSGLPVGTSQIAFHHFLPLT